MPNEADIDYINVEATAKVKGAKDLDLFANALEKVARAKADATRDTGNFDHLLDTMTGFKNVGNIGPSLSKVAEAFTEISAGLSQLASVPKLDTVQATMQSLADTFGKFNGLSLPNFKTFTDGLASFNETIKALDPASAEKLNNMAPALERIGAIHATTGLTNALSKLPGAIAGITDADIAKLNSLAPALERISAAMTGANSQMLTSFKAMSKQLSGITSDMKKYTQALNNNAKSSRKAGHGQNFLKNMFTRLKNIAFKKLINTLINNIAMGVREGISNAYQYSVATNNQFASTMDQFATVALYFKNSIGAMLMPILNQLIQVIDNVADSIVNMLNYVNEAVASFTNQPTWTKAIKYQTKYADAANSSADALNRTILAIDEINKLNGDTGTGSSAAEDYSNMFKTVEVETTMRDLFGGVDIGTAIGKMVTQGFEKLKNPEFMNKLGKIFSETLKNISSFVSEADFTAIGSAIGGIFTTAFDKLKSGDLGTIIGNIINKVAQFINGLNGTTDWVALGESIAKNIKTALEAIHWDELFSAVALSIAESLIAPWETIFGLMKTTIGDMYNAMPSGLQEIMPDWVKELGKAQKPAVSTNYTQMQSDLKTIGKTGQLNTYDADTYANAKEAYNAAKAAGTLPSQNKTSAVDNAVSDIDNILTGGAFSSYARSLADMLDLDANDPTSWLNLLPGYKLISDAVGLFGFASGGFPDNGSLFLANESGPEMVGSIGTHTAVANNGQIIEGIKEGVREAMSESGAGGDWTIQIVDPNGTLEAQTVINTVERKNRRNGKTVLSLGV